jgi:dihydroorotate dehydrogenase
MLYSLIRPLLFRLDAETAHNVTLGTLRFLNDYGLDTLLNKPIPAQPIEVMGLSFPNPVGLAAGLDKNGDYLDALAALGFGFVEIGTVTPLPQPGNPKPRLFRYPEAEAIINRMGFNNDGVDATVDNIKRSRFQGVLGINIGKNALTPMERAVDDYLTCLNKVYLYASYVTINISSPNTKNLRDLQSSTALSELLGRLKMRQLELAQQHGRYVPLVVKLAPDLEDEAIDDIAKVLLAKEIDGVIATNTTLSRDGVQHIPQAGAAHRAGTEG